MGSARTARRLRSRFRRGVPMAEVALPPETDSARFDAGARAIYDLVMGEAAPRGGAVSVGYLNGLMAGAMSALLTFAGRGAAIDTLELLGRHVKGSAR